MRTKMAEGKKENIAENEKLLAELCKKKIELKKQLDQSNDEENDKWKSFVREFNHDMDELGNALKDFTTDNEN